jgi:uncharacterized RDD family membrane protein YckC
MFEEAATGPGGACYAGFWIRVAANVLDVLMLGAVNMAVFMATTMATAPSGIGSVSAGISEAVVESGVLLPPLIIVGCWIVWGATPGKMMLGLRIVDEPTGGRPSAWQCIGRYFMALVALACAGIGYVYIAIDPRKQGWHDKIVRTLVVRRGPAV